MSYEFTKSDGVTPVIVADGSVDAIQFSLKLIGKNVGNYGEPIAENIVHHLENFASASAPANVTQGQLWFDAGNSVLKVYNGTTYESLISSAGGATVIDGDLQISGDIIPTGPGQDVGTPGQPFANIYGQATSALYADLAERFAADDVYEPGTIVMIGGECEITKTTEKLSTNVFGVVSDNPGFMLNAKAGTDDTHPFVALAGRVETKVEGTVTKGQRLVCGETPGTAVAVDDVTNLNPFAVIGRALADKTSTGTGKVMVVVGAK